jgi:hypothetical protein
LYSLAVSTSENIPLFFPFPFVIYEFKKQTVFTGIEIKAKTINIKRIENTNFIPLNKKTIVDYSVIRPYSLDDFIKMSWGNEEDFFSFMAGLSSNIQRSFFFQMIFGEMEISVLYY